MDLRNATLIRMAHRKPLGTTCRITFARNTWDRMPEIGDCFESEAGTAYEIIGVEENRARNNYLLERVADTSGQAGYIYEFYWLPRNKKAA